MASSHKQLLRASKEDYAAAKDRLRELAEEDGRELWYDDRKSMVGFRGQSLADLADFAQKCKKILQSVEEARLNKGEMEKRKDDMKLAKEKIEEARKFVYTDKAAARLQKNMARMFLDSDEDEDDALMNQVDDVVKMYEC